MKRLTTGIGGDTNVNMEIDAKRPWQNDPTTDVVESPPKPPQPQPVPPPPPGRHIEVTATENLGSKDQG